MEFLKYNFGFDAKEKKGQIREGVLKMNFDEFVSQYMTYGVLAENIIEQEGKASISASDLMLSDSSVYEEPLVRAIWRLLHEHNIKVALDVVRDNMTHYIKRLRAIYGDDDTYDMAISNAFGW